MRLLWIAALCLSACSGRSPGPLPLEAPVAITPADTHFTPSSGQRFLVGLPSGGAGGYQWHLEEGYDSRVVRLMSERVGELPAGAPLGRFADEIFEFESLAAGETTLAFSQYRSWEGPERAVESVSFRVTVR